MQSSIFQIEIGSGMYNLKTETSDTDILVIYLDGVVNSNSIIRTHHQLQYIKDNKDGSTIDYIFTSLTQFLNNILSGDSTINYEVLKSEAFKNHSKEFKFLSELEVFDNINVIKSYLGMAKRDLKVIKGEFSTKKLYHISRGILFAEAVLNSRNIFDVLKENYSDLKEIRETTSNHADYYLGFDLDIIKSSEIKMNKLREQIQNKEFKLTADDVLIIDSIISNIVNQKMYKVKRSINYKKLIVNAVYNNKFNY
jgi:hypothetical protein